MDFFTTAIVDAGGSVDEREFLAAASAMLNARPWAQVREGIPDWHPRNDGDEEETVDDGSGVITEEHPAADAAAENGGEGEGDGEEPNPVLEALNRFQTTITGRLDALERGGEREERQPAAAAREEAGGEALTDEAFEALVDQLPDENFDDEGYLTPAGQIALMRLVAREVAREEVSPDRQARDEERRDAEAAELEEKYPALRDEKFADEMIEATIARAKRAGNPQLALEPSYLEETYLIHEARRRAAAETPAGQREPGVVLERGSAAPAKPAKQKDEGDRIVALAKRSHFRLGD